MLISLAMWRSRMHQARRALQYFSASKNRCSMVRRRSVIRSASDQGAAASPLASARAPNAARAAKERFVARSRSPTSSGA